MLKYACVVIGRTSIPVPISGWFKFKILYNDGPNYESMSYLVQNQDDGHSLFASKQSSWTLNFVYLANVPGKSPQAPAHNRKRGELATILFHTFLISSYIAEKGENTSYAMLSTVSSLYM